jgi:hypothetical protein
MDDHFKAMGNDSLKRLDVSKLKEPPRSPFPWGALVVLVLVVGAAGGGWWAYRAGYLPSISAPGLGPGVAEQQAAIADKTAADLGDPFGDHSLAAPEPRAAPEAVAFPEAPEHAAVHVGPSSDRAVGVTDAAVRKQFADRSAEARRGIANLQKQLTPHVFTAATISAQLAEADKVQWPKANGPYTYLGWLQKQWADAKTQGKGQLAFDLESKIIEYHSLRKASDARLVHETEVIESLKKRIDVEQERAKQADADLAALP